MRIAGDGGDAEGVFEANGVLDEAGGEGLLEGAELRLGEAGDENFHLVVVHAQGARGGLGFDANEEAFGGKSAEAEVLRDILSDTAAESGEEQLGGGHAVVGGAALRGLVDDDAMMAGLGRKAGTAGKLQGHVQGTNSR